MTITRVHVPLGDISVTEPDPFDTTSAEPADLEVGSFALEAVYRVELNKDGTAVQSRDFEYLRLVVERLDGDGDMVKTVLDYLSVDEVTKLRDLLCEVNLPQVVTP